MVLFNFLIKKIQMGFEMDERKPIPFDKYQMSISGKQHAFLKRGHVSEKKLRVRGDAKTSCANLNEPRTS